VPNIRRSYCSFSRNMSLSLRAPAVTGKLKLKQSLSVKGRCNTIPQQRLPRVPKIHKDVLIKEVERLCKVGILEQQYASEWASP
jgi:hypothetical protein